MASRSTDAAEKNETKYKRKYKAMKLQLRDVELEADSLSKKITKYDRTLRELKFERSFLLDKLNELQNGSAPESEASSELEEITAEKAKRPEKDPNAPKRPANAFFMFCQEERSKFREENQEASLSELTKILGIHWKELSKSEKQKYYDMYDQDKLRYEKEMSSYAGPLPQQSRTEEEPYSEALQSAELEDEHRYDEYSNPPNYPIGSDEPQDYSDRSD